MGLNADAGLAYGVIIPPYIDDNYTPNPLIRGEDEDYYFELDTYLASRAGLTSPYDTDFPTHFDELPYHEQEHALAEWRRSPEGIAFDKRREAYWNAKAKLVENSPITAIHFGHYDDPEGPRIILALNGTIQRGDCWKPQKLAPSYLAQPTATRISKAITFCEENDLTSFEDASWLLFAHYG